ncbi:hypothetical protein V5J35_000155 [Endozoicomonas sp. NE40]|uniref:F5/8 type C domain-containing protein n=1 Tax=Endozoicomonas lisbonensis TaxID=3120522 RepID=A0ABV2SDE4_9GAMM
MFVIVPEIDIPGHGKMLSDFRKDAAFECPSMSVVTGRGWEGEHGPRWNLDYTGKSANSPRSGREFMFGLIEEFAPWFSGPYFHIGTDEVPEWGNLTSCAELASYVADSDHLREIGDPLVEFINEANDVIKGLGKQTQKWNWYERSPISFDADNDIRIDAWIGNALDYYTEKGYNTTLTGTPYLYLTPGFPNTMPNPPKIYTLEGSASPDMTGVKLSLWADTAYKWPDQQLEKLMVTPRTVTAERNWFGAHEDDSTFDEFLERMDTIGGAPLVVGEASAVPRDNWSVMAVSSEEIQRGDGGASNLFSGRTDSLWETRHSAGYDTYPHTVDIDMGDTYEVVGARFHPRQNGADRLRGLIGTYSFYVSEDGETWKMIVGSSEKDGSFSYPGNYVGRDKKAKTIHFEMEKARYFRFVAESPFEEGSRWASLAEIDIFGNKVGDEPVTVPESTYHIRSKADLSTCMRVDREEGDVANNDSMKMGKCLNTDDYQEWLTVDEGVVDGINYVSIRPVNTPDQCLDVNFNTGGLVTWDCHLGDNQLFRVHEDQYRYGYSTIKPKSAGNCMTISGDNNDDVAEGDRVSFSGCSDTNKKQWVLVP